MAVSLGRSVQREAQGALQRLLFDPEDRRRADPLLVLPSHGPAPSGRLRAAARASGRAREDAGLFGPESVTWRVHADLPSMLVGGLAALLLQSLHPLAMAGVAAHSRYREDPLGRLRRTASFLATTTYGSTAEADEAIARIRAVHDRVRGRSGDGRAYAASDPELLEFVHVAEVTSFLKAHRFYGPLDLRPGDRDRYLEEMAVLARRLGALEVPTSEHEVAQYFSRVRPLLRATPEAREATAFLRGADLLGSWAERPARSLLLSAAIGILPFWARVELGLRPASLAELVAVRHLASAGLAALRFALGPPVVARVSSAHSAA